MPELTVKQININGYQGASVQLREYEWFIETIRANRRTMSIEQAVNTALDTMPESFTIREFLLENRSEVLSMSIFTYNEEAHMKNERKEGYEDGALNSKVELIERKMNFGVSFEQACNEIGLTDEEISCCRAKMTLPH